MFDEKILQVATPIMAALLASPRANAGAPLETFANDAIECAKLLIEKASTINNINATKQPTPESYL